MTTAQETDRERRATRSSSVFDLMERVKMPALWICVVIMGGFGVLSLFGDLFQKKAQGEEVELGAFEIPGGEKVVLTNYQFFEESQQVVPRLHEFFGGRGHTDYSQVGSSLLKVQIRDEEELAWAWFILREAARAAGIVVTDEVVISGSKKAGVNMTLRDYYRAESEEKRMVRRELIAIDRFRDALDRAQPDATWDTLYERFKSTYEDLRASFVLFDTQKTELAFDPRNDPEDRKKLDLWLAANPGIRNQKRMPEELDAKVLYVRFKDESTENLKKQHDERWAPLVAGLKLEVTDEKLRTRFDVFRSAWDVPLRLAAEAFEKSVESRPDSRTVDRPTEFESVKERLTIEFFATKLAEKAFEEVTRAENPMTFEDAMQKYGLKLTEVSHLDSLRIQQHPDFASPRAAMAMLQGLREKTIKPGDVYKYSGDAALATGPVEEPGSSVAIWRLVGYHAERPATLDDPGVLDFFVTEYKKKKKQDLAKEEAEAFKKAVEERVNAAVDAKAKELDAELKVVGDRRIAEAQLDRGNPEHQPKVLEIENEERQKRDAKLDEERARVEPSMFMATAAERFLTVRNTGWIAKTANRNATFQASEQLTTGEKAEQFFRKAARRLALAGVTPGRMGPVESEPNWYAAAVPLLLEKRAPAPADIYKLSRSQLDQLKNQVSPRVQSQQFWTYDNFKRPEWFNLNVPNLEKGIEAKRKADQERAEKQRLREENRKKQARSQAEKFAQDAMQARPLFSGEDW